jgi:hypothetical protein
MTRAGTMFATAGAIAMLALTQTTDTRAQQARPDLVDPIHRGRTCARDPVLPVR